MPNPSIARLRECLEPDEVAREIDRRGALRRAAAKRRWQRFKEDYPGRPHYSVATVQFCERWLLQHRKRGWECALAEIVHYLRRDARAALGEECADEIQDRGTAKMLRLLGAQLWRAYDGMWARGVRPR
jgi:hypothetical protein